MKYCSKCKQPREFFDFCKDSRSKDGKQSVCKKCKTENAIAYYKANPDKKKNENPEVRRKRQLRKYYKNRLHSNVANLVRRGLGKNKNSKTFDLLGYTQQQLKEHLEKQFVNGMTWDNYGKWHIDHKIPRAALPYQVATEENFKKCWALDNLQPLWAIDNLRKSDKFFV
jgi:hypothetical protein